jgi:hypothetical protein
VGPTADEVEGNSPSEELERANAGGDEVAKQDQEQAKFRDEAQRGIDSLPTTEKPNLPGGPSGDEAASERAGKKGSTESDPESASEDPPEDGQKASGGGVGGLITRLNKKRRQSAAVILVVIALGGGVAGFFEFVQHELVDIEQNITHYFDKRLQHEAQKEVPKLYEKVFAKGSKEEGDQNTGDPIADADHNYSLDTFAADANIAGEDYGSSGEVDALTTTDGERLNVNSTTLNDPDSPLMDHLDGRFPPLDFLRLSIRSRNLDGVWGIVRSLLTGKDEPVSDDPATLEKQVNDSVVAAEENTNGAPETESGDESGAKEDLSTSEGTAETEATLGVGPANTALALCGSVGLSEAIHRSLWITRVAQLVRFSNGVTLDSGDQEKPGDLHANQLGVFMRLFSGFAKSGGWQVLTGAKGSKVSDLEKSKFAANPSGGLSNVTNVIDGAQPVCGPINTFISKLPFGVYIVPVGLDVAEGLSVADDPELIAVLQSVAVSAAKNFGVSKALGYLAGVATDAASKPLIDVTKATGADVVDATISGYDNYSNMLEMSSGGERLSPAQVADLNQEADTEYVQSAEQKGLAYQLFSPNYDNSLVTDLILKTPNSTGQLATGFDTMVAAISSPLDSKQLASIGSFVVANSPTAMADDPADESEDPSGWGVQQFGLPDSLLNEFPDPEANEQAIIKYLCAQPGEGGDQPGLYDGDCSGGGNSSSELTDQNDQHHDPYHDYVRECFTNPDSNAVAEANGAEAECSPDAHGTAGAPDIYDRFRVYRFDLGIANMMTSYNNSTDDQNPNGASGTTTTTSGGSSGSLPTGTAQSFAKDILANSKIGYEFDAKTDMQDAANGQPGTCHVAVSQNLLALLDYLSQAGFTFNISAIESSCTGHDGAASGSMEDPHYAGRAADIVNVNGDPTASSGIGRTINDVKVMQDLAPLMPPSPSTTNWTLWSGFGQIGCGPEPDPTLPAGIHQFSDACTHLHMQVSS